ncbi:hypothetical protein K435DRAFT_756777 [Dendrothele bispora CBS 962.96]|uniref:Uncharacterized protein n=1 Tax=Dendrothele bispora (strain CBS 962.96) TaxID=1314807 RepID=A0A4S8LX00_DENBC|nr:hypothetical protein K435DRAFT_756777 [Dendrothele bispora CBS 962.96]
MSTLAPVWLLLDDRLITFLPEGKWATIADSRWVGNSTTWDESGSLPSTYILVEFQGLSISFIGNTPSTSDSPTTFLASIDSGVPYNTSMPVAEVTQYYLQWYSTPVLSDGFHFVNLSTIVTDVDYAIVTAGESTPLSSDSIIIVDNDNSEIWYTGDWEQDESILNTKPNLPDGPALGNSTHRSGTPGSSFEFKFSGIRVGVWGVFQWQRSGSVKIDFTLDGATSSQEIVADKNPGFSEQRNYPFFQAEQLTPGNHTLIANITEATGSQVFAFDYILYTPDFTSLSKKPTFGRTSNPASPVSRVFPTGTETAGSMNSTIVSPDVGTKNVNVGAIAGGVVAGVTVCMALLTIFFLRRQRKMRGKVVPQPYRGSEAITIARDSSLIAENFVPSSISQPVSIKAHSHSKSTTTTRSNSLLQGSELNQGDLVSRSSHLTLESWSESPGSSRNEYTQNQIDELRRRIDFLAQENARAGVASPPDYS